VIPESVNLQDIVEIHFASQEKTDLGWNPLMDNRSLREIHRKSGARHIQSNWIPTLVESATHCRLVCRGWVPSRVRWDPINERVRVVTGVSLSEIQEIINGCQWSISEDGSCYKKTEIGD